MAWLDELFDASFRGAPFLVRTARTRGGQRLANHQYPLRDRPYSEDLGRRQRSYTVEAFTLGDTAFLDRDALVAALESGGAGTLIHPTFGVLSVTVDDWTVAEDLTGEMGICRFTIQFMESGDIAVPTVSADTSAQAGTAADTATSANESAFGEGFA